MLSIGSCWRKWDLHFHTPSSYDYKNKGISNQEIVDTLIDKGVSAVAITDHHFIDVKRIKELQELSAGRLLVLPGIEFRSELGGDESIHFIGIFPENSNIEELWLKLKVPCDILETTVQEKGDEFVYCDFKKTCDLIHDLGGIVTVHAGGKSNTLEEIGNNSEFKKKIKTDLLQQYIDILEIGGLKDINVYNEIVFPAVNIKRPLILCSDNHNVREYTVKSSLWIKSELSFEGLKQIIYEPESRVCIQDDFPEESRKKLSISNIEYKNCNEFIIEEQSIPINRDLVCIIGGRGAGKSALLETLAYCFGKQNKTSRQGHRPSGSTFVDVFKAKPRSDFEIELTFKNLDGNESKYTTTLKSQDTICTTPILFLGQNNIESYANSNRTEHSIHQLTFETILKNSSNSEELLKCRQDIEDLRDKLRDFNVEVTSLRNKISATNESQLESEKEQIEKELELLTASETKSIVEGFKEAAKKYNSLKDIERIIGEVESTSHSSQGTIFTLLRKFEQEVSDYIFKANAIATELTDNEIEIKLDLSDFKSQIESLKVQIDKVAILRDYDNGIQKIKEQLDGKTELSVAYLTSQQNRLKEVVEYLEGIKKDKAILDKLIKERKAEFKLLKIAYNSYKNEYDKAIEEFYQQNSDVLSSLSLKAVSDLNIYNLIDSLYEKSDGRKYSGYDGFISKWLEIDVEDIDFSLDLWIEGIVDNWDSKGDVFIGLSLSSFESLVYHDYYYLDTEILYKLGDGDFKPLNELSLGQKGTVLLKLFLCSGNNCPIIIDQPEDHLDNDFIYKDLVKTIRSAKEKRQVILVTHDANIVVNGDAEQVIVARYSNASINYPVSGALEDNDVRNIVSDILEGGEDAFLKRERKYRIASSKRIY